MIEIYVKVVKHWGNKRNNGKSKWQKEKMKRKT